ncbi:hypothetical protein VKT23_001756 [Stygiomarasmius scandens]|uniref:Uncharacterized protein n=1 Tax=Marasmiellus scandens TaxID=2682957 RepID=A0ABR1JZV8_9AGAR
MGKWTSDYYDQVLNTKIKSLVSGAIKRARLEKTGEPTISYENFVEELDVGDSFTSTIIDCLVKELADRRSRPSASDRRLIAERTAKNLRTLSSPFRIYWGRSRRSSSRRPMEHITSAPHDIDLEEDEEIFVDNLTDGDTVTSDGPRTDMYEPGSTSSIGYPLIRQASPIPVSGSDEPVSMPAYGSSSAPWSRASTTHLHNIGAVLSRHAPSSSIVRRPSRSRAVDFNDFASFSSRRRTSIRDALSSRPESDPSTSHDREPSSRESIYIRPSTRRFFASGVIPRRHRSEGEFNVWNDLTESEPEDRLPFLPSPPQWLAMDSPPPDNDAETSEERIITGPRLRRGGVRAPESILSRHVSPVTIRTTSDLFPTPPGLSALTSVPFSAGDSPRLNTDSVPEPVSYPTPRSADEENST